MKILFLFCFFSIHSLYAGHWTVQEKTPYELQALIESFNLDYLTDEEKKSLEENLNELDGLMTSLEDRDRFFIAKSTIYKWVLKNSPNTKPPKTFTLYDFNTKGKEAKLNNFSKWLLMAIKADVASITSLPTYNSYLQELRTKGRTTNFISLEKRISLIKPWAYLYTKESPDQISLRLIKYQFNLLGSLVSQYKLFYRFKGKPLPSLQPKKLTYFRFDDGKQKDKENGESELIGKLDSVIKMHKKNNLPLPKNDWTINTKDEWQPKDDMTLSKASVMNLENPDADPNYKAPVDLPKPVNDWDIE